MVDEEILALHSLSFAGQLLVWSGRQWVNQRSDWPDVGDELSGPMGSMAGRALADSLDELYALLERASLRPIVFGASSSREIASDEAFIVRLVMLEQHHQSAWVYGRLEQILPPSAARRAVAIVATIAHLLDQAGYEVSLVAPYGDDARPAPGYQVAETKVTIH